MASPESVKNSDKFQVEIDEMEKIKQAFDNIKNECQAVMNKIQMNAERKKKNINKANGMVKESKLLKSHGLEMENQMKSSFQNYSIHNSKMEGIQTVFLALMESVPKLENEIQDMRIDLEKCRAHWKMHFENHAEIFKKQEGIYQSIGWASNYRKLFMEKENFESVRAEKEKLVAELIAKSDIIERDIMEIIRDELPWSKTCVLFAELMLKNMQIKKSVQAAEAEMRTFFVAPDDVTNIGVVKKAVTPKVVHMETENGPNFVPSNIDKPKEHTSTLPPKFVQIETENASDFIYVNIDEPKEVRNQLTPKFTQMETEKVSNLVQMNLDNPNEHGQLQPKFMALQIETEKTTNIVKVNIEKPNERNQISPKFAEIETDNASDFDQSNSVDPNEGNETFSFGNFLENFGRNNVESGGNFLKNFGINSVESGENFLENFAIANGGSGNFLENFGNPNGGGGPSTSQPSYIGFPFNFGTQSEPGSSDQMPEGGFSFMF